MCFIFVASFHLGRGIVGFICINDLDCIDDFSTCAQMPDRSPLKEDGFICPECEGTVHHSRGAHGSRSLWPLLTLVDNQEAENYKC